MGLGEVEMRYVRVKWEHDFEDDPVVYLSELGEDGYELRKVQIYRDGRTEWADETRETETVGLSEIAFPSNEEISSSPGFCARDISREEFERFWREAKS
ncbi:DUF6881 domain-containing protein [Nocardiopsis rhodophaea]